MFFTWLVTRTPFFTKTGLTKPQLISLFLLKVIAAIFYGWVGIYYSTTAQMVDTWNYHSQSLLEYRLLWEDPHEYLTNLFHSNYPDGYGNVFASDTSYWNDLKSNVFIKFLSILNIFSFGHYYVNVIFYSFITLFGPIALYRVWKEIYPGRKLLLIAAVFLIPSFLFWSSGIHKEGLLFLALAGLLYHFYFSLRDGLTIKRIAIILACLVGLFALRNFLLVVLTPALIAWALSVRLGRKPIFVFGAVYAVFIILFFTARLIDNRADFPQLVVDKQKAFLRFKGKSSIPIKELDPTVTSFILKTPQAMTLSVMRPYPSDIRHLFSLMAGIETNMMLLLVLLYFLFRRKEKSPPDAFIYFSIFFSISLLLTIGFSVNNLGAIVRYRSIILPLILTPVMWGTDWNRLFGLILPRLKKEPQAAAR